MEIKKNWVYYMQEGIRNMFKKTEDFECHPDGECWCKEEEFPTIPDSYDKDTCLSPEAIEQLRLEENLVDRLDKKFSAHK
jgi:hypothetical protein